MATFFDYTCDACGKDFCERISVMNLVLDLTEEAYCLECLSEREGQSSQHFYHWILEYVMARDCFKTPWTHFNASPCPRITDGSCFCTVTP